MKPYRLIPLILFLALLFGLSRTGVSRTQAVTPTLSLVAPAAPQPANSPIDIQVAISNTTNLGAFELDLVYDRALLQVSGITLTSFLGQMSGCNPSAARCAVALGPLDQSSGATALGAYSYGTGAGPNNDGVLAMIRLTPKGIPGTVALRIANALVTDIAGSPLAPTTQDATLVLSATQQLFLPVITHGGRTSNNLYVPVIQR